MLHETKSMIVSGNAAQTRSPAGTISFALSEESRGCDDDE